MRTELPMPVGVALGVRLFRMRRALSLWSRLARTIGMFSARMSVTLSSGCMSATMLLAVSTALKNLLGLTSLAIIEADESMTTAMSSLTWWVS